MRYFEDSRIVSIQDLYTIVNDEGKRIYSDNLLQKIQSGDFNCLNEIDFEDRNNRYFMEPLLFAVKNSEFGTYEVFKYYGEELQKQDLTIPTEIVINEPDVLEDTAITDNPTLVLYFAKINPEIILYISEDLINDGEFIEELCKVGDREAIMYAIKACDIQEVLQDNPDLASNPAFMKEAVREDASLLKYADESLKNSYEFIKETSMENRDVIDYVVKHTEEFGKDALKGARDSLEEHFIADATKDVEEERKKIQEEKLKMEGKENNENALKELEKKEKGLNSIEDTMRKFQETPEEKKPRRAHLYLQYLEDAPEYYIQELQKYEKIYIAEREKEKAEKIEKGNLQITPEQIEEKTKKARISGINDETREIREEYIRQTEEKEVTDYDRGANE